MVGLKGLNARAFELDDFAKAHPREVRDRLCVFKEVVVDLLAQFVSVLG